ncbi:MAG: hypothetical protein ACI8T1_001324 [Verrucomicrobiales bacterium]|jgi:hypothetical protein
MTDSASTSRREAFWILGIWIVFAAWVLGYSALRAYPEDPSTMTLAYGFPSWVLWGIALPWLVATAVTIGFCLFVMKDEQV